MILSSFFHLNLVFYYVLDLQLLKIQLNLELSADTAHAEAAWLQPYQCCLTSVQTEREFCHVLCHVG